MANIESKGNFIMITPNLSMKMNTSPIAMFKILGIDEEGTTEYYPIISNFYDTVLWHGASDPLIDASYNTVPPQVLQDHMVNKIEYNNNIYWLSKIDIGSLIYRTIDNSANYITISTIDDWNTYTVAFTGGVQ